MLRRRREHGISLIEVMVVVTIVALTLVLAAPGFGNWLANARIRTTAEALNAGLQLAKAEAVTRNTRARFQLTSTLDDTCVLSTSGVNWVVNLDPDAQATAVVGNCAAAPSDTVAPRIVQSRAAVEGSGSTVVQASASSVVFNGLGRLAPAPAGNVTFEVRGAQASDCLLAGGELTCLRVVVSPAGQVRLCNPRFAANDAQGCP